MSTTFEEIDALFLDAGNTVLFMDYDLLSEWATAAGAPLGPDAMRRAEAKARLEVSRYLGGGVSSESATTLEVYVRAMLRAAADSAGCRPGQYDGAAPGLLGAWRQGQGRLWTRPAPGIAPALARARQAGLRLGVISNSDGSVASRLADLGLAASFDAIVDSGRVGVEKPDPRIFAHGLRALGVMAERSLYAGDLHSVDVAGARRAGLQAVLMDPFGDWEGAPGVDCPTARDVPELIERLLAARA